MGEHVLVVGSGAREHALAWRLAAEGARVSVAPGNPLMNDVAEVRADVAVDDHAAIAALANADSADLVVVGPEAPLVDGLVDRLTTVGISAFGPTAAAARVEASKAFARDVCRAAGVAMARGAAFESVTPAVDYAALLGFPVVVKADGLAAGKGVTIAATLPEAEGAIREAMEAGRFGASGRRVVVEEFLSGVEASVIAVCDGTNAVMLPPARDHKRLHDGDVGPNTGGMGAYSPVAELGEVELLTLRATVFTPVLREMAARGAVFRGALFAGLMLTADGPRVLEFNARFGDPETQAILPRLDTPLLPLLHAATSGRLEGVASILPAKVDATAGVTLAASGYPDAPRQGDLVRGIDAARDAGALVFGAGVAADGRGGLVTGGGRVLTVVGRGSDFEAAAEAAYRAADLIDFQGKQLRRDIGRAVLGAAA
jgi:phosphoribosylamine--glycine ligase